MQKPVEGFELDQDPRKAFILMLIREMENIAKFLYSSSTRLQACAIEPLMGLIDSLDGKSHERLSKDYELLRQIVVGGVTGDEVRQAREIYRRTSAYLHQNYLKEFAWVKPFNPHPQHIGAER